MLKNVICTQCLIMESVSSSIFSVRVKYVCCNERRRRFLLVALQMTTVLFEEFVGRKYS